MNLTSSPAPQSDSAIAEHDYKVPAAQKVLDILEYMATRHEALTQTEIAIGLRRSIHEVYRVIQLLEGRGYLNRVAPDRYRLSLKLFELAHQHPPVNRMVECALPVMRRLAEQTDQSCHLVVLGGLQALVILQVDSPLPMRYSVALGSHFPLLETSSGAVLLAAQSTPERERLIGAITALGEAPDGHDKTLSRLGEIDRLGYEMRQSLAVDGCVNISVPVRDHLGQVVSALTVPYLAQKRARSAAPAVLAAALQAAGEISRALGAAVSEAEAPP